MNFIDVNQTRIEIRQIPGSNTLAPLVFLHEGLGSVSMWQSRQMDWPQAVCQASGRSGWLYSRRGYGQSEAIADVRGQNRLTPDYMHKEAWEVLPKLLSVCGISQPVLVGHSDGASIALLHAARHDVAGVVAIAPHLFVEDITLRSIEAAKAAFEQGDFRSRLARFHADVDCAFWQWNDVWLSEGFRSFDIQQECLAIHAPLLAIQGIDDPYGSLQHIELLHTNGVVQREVLQNCGHSPHREQAQISQQLIVNFLRELP